MTKMFTIDGKPMRTWSPVTGCLHDCYNGGCWANRLALKFQTQGKPKYIGGFEPTFHEKELKVKFKAGKFIFVVSMGDLFGDWVNREWIEQVLEVIRSFPDTNFLLQTKNPSRYQQFILPANTYTGTTIETNRPNRVSKAPYVQERWKAIRLLPSIQRKFLSIEPIMDFDLDPFFNMIRLMAPDIIEVGADNYHCGFA